MWSIPIALVALAGLRALPVDAVPAYGNGTSTGILSVAPAATATSSPNESIGQIIYDSVDTAEDTGITSPPVVQVMEQVGTGSLILTPVTPDAAPFDPSLTSRASDSITQVDVTLTTGGGANGFNITIPHSLCRSTSVGPFTFINGQSSQSATLDQLYTSFVTTHHTGQTLHDFTLNKALGLADSLNSTVQSNICPPDDSTDLDSNGRELLQYAPGDVDAYYTAVVLGLTGGAFITYPGIYYSIASNITNAERAGGLTATAFMTGFVVAIINRLRENAVLNPLEAWLLNTVLGCAANFNSVRQTITNCMTPADLSRSVQDLATQTSADVFFGRDVPIGVQNSSPGDIEMVDLSGVDSCG